MQAHVQAKERALTVRAAYEGISVQNPVGVLNQRNGWGCACRVVKVIEHSEGACRLDPVNGPKLVASARGGGAVEVAVGRLHQSGKGAPPIGKPTKIVENGELTSRSNLEDHSITTASALFRSSVKVPVASLNQWSCRKFTVSAVELEKRRE